TYPVRNLYVNTYYHGLGNNSENDNNPTVTNYNTYPNKYRYYVNHTTAPPVTKEHEDVEMTDASPPDYEKVVPMFDGKNMDDSSFVFRCRSRYDKYKYYYTRPKEAERWYRMDEIYKQKDYPNPERFLSRIEKEYRIERNIEDIKNLMLKLRHNWGKQVKPSVRKVFYDLPKEGYIKCLKKCDDFPNTYRIEYLERNDTPANRTLSLMVEIRRRRKDGNFKATYAKDKPRDNPPEKQKDFVENKEKDFNYGGNSRRNSSWRDNKTSSNNPLLKSYAVQEFEKLDGNKYDEPIGMVNDSGSHINVIHPNLVKIGLKVKKEPANYLTVNEEFKLKLWLMDRQDGKAKGHEFRTTCRLSKEGTDLLLLGSKFTDKHYTKYGHYEYLVMPFGLTIAPATF
ncbi:hypothetical protein PIROE2DRAFT_6342, partial [Piromyces sp. E2]